MKPIYVRIIKTIAFSPPWIAVIIVGLTYVIPGKWGGTWWGEALMLLVAVVTTAVIYWVLVVEDRKKDTFRS